MRRLSVLIPAFLVLGFFSRLGAEEKVSFSEQIRPLLSDRCFKCHGFDDETREADLGLHTHDAATRDLGGYRAIDLGSPEASEVLLRLVSDDPDDVMPPPSSNKPKFSPEEVELVRRWIEQGAEYETHWAFEKPVRPDLPEGDATHPVDRFVDERLAEAGIAKNDRADPSTLLRRLSYDLRGVPPTVEETNTFLAESQADPETAWNAAVDRFLASPLYGERWARDWLDLARYADTNGYEKDRPRSIWPYRDWVVDALNADMPYDRFTVEQLAGDMLPDPTIDQLVATGFHRNTMLNEEGGIDPLEFRFHAMVDRVATTGTVWMGLTTGCAQCHTHKFDPILHTDYFSMMALLNNADELEIEVPSDEVGKQRAAIEKQIAERETLALAEVDAAQVAAWRKGFETQRADWTPLAPVETKSNLPFLQVEEDLSVYASGDFTKRDVFELGFDLSQLGFESPVTAIRLEALPDERLPGGGPGAAYYEGRKGDFFLSEITAFKGGEALALDDASVSFGKISVGSGKAEGMNIFDGDGSTGWSTATREGEAHELVVNLAAPVDPTGRLDVKLLFERHFVAALGRFRVSFTSSTGEVTALDPVLPAGDATDEEWNLAWLRLAPEAAELRKPIEALRNRLPDHPTTLVFAERPAENPRPTHLHHRGEYLSPKQEVPPAPPHFLPPFAEGEPANRLAFAKWLVSDRNPLAGRVAANRAWRAIFGAGIVDTDDDFGYQSELPSHPELLDWLAVEFAESGWSFKKLHRLLVTSEAYRRDGSVSSEQLERDPNNRLLARGPRFRLPAEMIRDGALRASGLLSEKRGGPGVYPPQPESVTAMAYGNTAWKVSEGEDRYRRSLYTFAKRTAPFAAYLAFDGPTGESCLPQRDRSNTPLQALTLLNDPMFGEAAEALAHATGLNDPSNPVASLDAMFRRVLTRPPTESERDEFLAFYEAQKARLQSGELDPVALLSDAPADRAAEIAAWKMVARVLLNLDEAITKG